MTASVIHLIRGFPSRGKMFLSFNLVEPPRAGITANLVVTIPPNIEIVAFRQEPARPLFVAPVSTHIVVDVLSVT